MISLEHNHVVDAVRLIRRALIERTAKAELEGGDA